MSISMLAREFAWKAKVSPEFVLAASQGNLFATLVE